MDTSALLKAIIETAIDGIITIDDRGLIEMVNPSACRLFKYSAEELVGKNVSVLMTSSDKENHDFYIDNYRKTYIPKIIGNGREVTGLCKDGIEFPFRLGVSEVKYFDKIIFAGFIHDLSREKEAEEELRLYSQHLEFLVEERTLSLNSSLEALQKAQHEISLSLEKEKELNQLKSEFVSIASHEFRTPLSKIQLSASLIDKYAEPFQSSQIKKHIKIIDNAVDNLTAILNDFLNLEKIGSGTIVPNLQFFNIKILAEVLREEMQSLTRSNQKIIYNHFGTSYSVKLDHQILRNCITNLLSNAIKYSEENTLIKFKTEIKDKKLMISIEDEGIGIPESEHKYVFTPFFRSKNSINIPGTGLGLNIVYKYTHILKGEITFKNAIKRGTVFTLTLPVYE